MALSTEAAVRSLALQLHLMAITGETQHSFSKVGFATKPYGDYPILEFHTGGCHPQ